MGNQTKQFSRVQNTVPPKAQQTQSIARERDNTLATKQAPLNSPATENDNLQQLQKSSLDLRSCPQCDRASTLTEGTAQRGSEVKCDQCGTQPQLRIQEIRNSQVDIIQTALAPKNTSVTTQDKRKTASTLHAPQHENQDTNMLGETSSDIKNQNQEEDQDQHHTDSVVVRHNETGETTYIDEAPEGDNAEDALDVA